MPILAGAAGVSALQGLPLSFVSLSWASRARVRELAPTLPLLIPGVGTQGGDAQATVQAGWRATPGHTTGPILVNASRAVLYASAADDFAQAARQAALGIRQALNAARSTPATPK